MLISTRTCSFGSRPAHKGVERGTAMNEQGDGLAIARERIAKEAAERTGSLDLGRLGLVELPKELFQLRHLRRLILGGLYYDENRRLIESKSKLANNRISCFEGLNELLELDGLFLHHCIGPNLSGIGRLPVLRTLDFSWNPVSDLSPLAGLSALQTLRCDHTPVNNLAPLAGLSELEFLDCRYSRVTDLEPLGGLKALRTLDINRTRVSNLKPLAGASALKTLVCIDTPVHDLTPLAGLRDLEQLYCQWTLITELSPLAGLIALHSFTCNGTNVGDLSPLAGLTALEFLDCAESRVIDLEPLAGLNALRYLRCNWTNVRDLSPLSGLSALQELYCGGTRVSDLAPLAGLTALHALLCSSTAVSDLSPLAELGALKRLYCSETQVTDLAPLSGLAALEFLDCSHTQVNDLSPLANLSALKHLDLNGCRLANLPRWLLEKPSLQNLIMFKCHTPGVPNAVLSQSQGENCLEALRAHVRDLEDGTVAIPDVKLMVLGNGRVGKTQLCRRLRGEAYDEVVPSTHGVLVTTARLPMTGQDGEARLNIWDFGGQDIYHGTHALFTRSSAIYLLIWTPVLEDTREYTDTDIVFRNHPLAYWVDYVRQLGNANSPVLVVQTRCDHPEEDKVCPVTEAELFSAFPFRKIVRYSAKTDRGRDSLNEALAEAVDWLRQREGIAVIGAGRDRVKQRLEAMRDADAKVATADRQYRTITQGLFRALCEEAGGVSSPDHLLSYLHNAGIVFYRPRLFRDDIILDQGWALDAIYTVFHREKSVKNIRRSKGRFTRADLEDWVWRERGYNVEEQNLLLSMMESCGICFVLRSRDPRNELDSEYVAPDLLPVRAEMEVELAQKWEENLPGEEAIFEYDLLHPGLMRSVISRIGKDAGLAADYWKGGVYLYEASTGSRGMIEEETIDTWRGRIRVQAQRGQATVLLQQLIKLVEQQQAQAGMTAAQVTTTIGISPMTEMAPQMPATKTDTPPPSFGQEASSAREWCVSYAWVDNTAEGKKREEFVDDLCAAAEKQGIHILRDKTDMGLGERISKFMLRIGRADRVFVVLSDKYLKSPFCMFELSEVWRSSHQEDEAFLKRIRVYALPCARIWTPLDRANYAIYWKQQHDELDAIVKSHGYNVLGEKDFQALRRMGDFYRNVGDILATVADVLQPRNLEDLVNYGFGD